ncbi:hypothetical protein FRC04_011062 [Tulasnella sp. 424]|nr:hypothetical protein FRC04_011062 [Tulasnella sp. 424]KAG8978381.1 hypothetical protein FRC05_010626 [Tulasnella sp. 425]
MASKGLLDQVKLIIPPLNGKLHKGQAGRVGVVGGSADYTGAPFFSAISALRVGADLSHVICEPGAGNVIKTYSPDLIVHPIMQEDSTPESVKSQLEGLLQRLHIIVVGPGLGREERTQSMGRVAIEVAKAQEKYIVLDADGLWLIQNEPHLVKDYKRAILTPNVVEFKRLCDSMKVPKDSPPEQLASLLAKAFGNVTIIQKGQQDIISNGDRTEVVDVEGGLKRVGGQGDILSGTVGTFMAWGKSYEEQNLKGSNDSNMKLEDIPLLAAIGACNVTRTASRLAFQKHGRGVLTSDMLAEVGPAYAELFGDVGEKGLKGNL